MSVSDDRWKKHQRKATRRVPWKKHPPEFVKLQTDWYAKLKAEGFRDLEFFTRDGESTTDLLKDSLGSLRKQYRPETEYYFRRARWWLHNHVFDTDENRRIWAHHCEGLTNIEVADKMEMNKWCIRNRVRKMKDKMLADGIFEQLEAEDIARDALRFSLKLYGKSSDKKS